MLNEKPLETFVGEYSNTSFFRKIAFIGDSLSSGEFETIDAEGNHGWHDMYEYSWGQFIARKSAPTQSSSLFQCPMSQVMIRRRQRNFQKCCLKLPNTLAIHT